MDLADIDPRAVYRHPGVPGVALVPVPGSWAMYGHNGDADMVIMYAVGDDRRWQLDPSDLEPLNNDEWCLCGQIDCKANAPDDGDMPFVVTRGEILARRVDEL